VNAKATAYSDDAPVDEEQMQEDLESANEELKDANEDGEHGGYAHEEFIDQSDDDLNIHVPEGDGEGDKVETASRGEKFVGGTAEEDLNRDTGETESNIAVSSFFKGTRIKLLVVTAIYVY
jgi:hypothetical protein